MLRKYFFRILINKTSSLFFLEICPHDTALFDDDCYWSPPGELSMDAANAECQSRGGKLASFNSEEAIEFTEDIWYAYKPKETSVYIVIRKHMVFNIVMMRYSSFITLKIKICTHIINLKHSAYCTTVPVGIISE